MLKLFKKLKKYGVRLRLTPWDPIPFVAITVERKGKTQLGKGWYKTKKGWKKQLFE